MNKKENSVTIFIIFWAVADPGPQGPGRSRAVY